MSKLAIIDLGTNIIKVLVGVVMPERYVFLYKKKVTLCIGNQSINNNISLENQQYIIHILLNIKKKLEREGIGCIIAKATSLLRQSSNASDVISAILWATGIEVEVISGSEEADLIYLGCTSTGSFTDEHNLIVDIGGGSVECIIFNQTGVLWKQSFEMGIRRVASWFSYSDPITSKELNQLKGYYSTALASLFTAAIPYKLFTLIGTSGAFRTLLALYNYCYPSAVSASNDQVRKLSVEQFYKIYPIILTRPVHIWQQQVCIDPIFLKLIPLSAVLIDLILKTGNLQTIIMIDSPLKIGLFMREWHRLKNLH
ncbi:MAG: hypothetical protein K2X94_02180 [Amoebophilaceae bacterium]|nr:hypothetical protein [Amoebophilaceae bacterium]